MSVIRWAAAVVAVGGLALSAILALFDAAGAGDWRKPFSRGGALSIDKPFDKGGSLSIHKVYVPKKFKIGKVETIQEVIIPVCWGRPQDCRDPVKPGQPPAAGGVTTEKQYPYYIVARFTCLSRRTGKPSGTLCDLTTRASESCDQAWDAMTTLLNDLWQQGFDPCAKCLETRNPDQYWNGGRPDYLQDGPCRAWSFFDGSILRVLAGSAILPGRASCLRPSGIAQAG